MIEGHIHTTDFLLALADLIGVDLVFAKRLDAMKNQSVEVLETEGMLLGGKFTIRLEFDGRRL